MSRVRAVAAGLQDRPVHATALALLFAGAAVLAIALAYGLSGFARAWSQLNGAWILLTLGAELLTLPAYALAYHAVVCVDGGSELPPALLARLVVAGFGPFAVAGGFALDRRALHVLQDDERRATMRVLGLGALEWALLAPAAWIATIVLLVDGDRRPLASLLWPWAVAVPVGFAVGLGVAHRWRGRGPSRGDGALRRAFSTALRSVGVLFALAGDLRRHWGAWTGTAGYWALDIAGLYGALRFVGLRLDLWETIVAFATGYALTRRSMPLGGAGVTEVLMTFALHWVGAPVLPALAGVVTYRVFNFLLPALPGFFAHSHVKPLLDAAAEQTTPASRS